MSRTGSFTAKLLFKRRWNASEVDPGLKSGHEGVSDSARPTGTNDVLKVGLEEQRVPPESKPICQLERDLVPLHADRRIRLPRAALRVLQVIAEETAHEKTGGTEERQLTDGFVRGDEHGAGDPTTAVAARPTELHQHLVEQAVEAPVPPCDARGALARDRVEVGVLAVVVPEPHLVVADETPVARETIHLVPGLANGKEGSVHRPVRAVMLVGADGGIAVVETSHHVRPLGGLHLDE